VLLPKEVLVLWQRLTGRTLDDADREEFLGRELLRRIGRYPTRQILTTAELVLRLTDDGGVLQLDEWHGALAAQERQEASRTARARQAIRAQLTRRAARDDAAAGRDRPPSSGRGRFDRYGNNRPPEQGPSGFY
jgi:hypothetical protein